MLLCVLNIDPFWVPFFSLAFTSCLSPVLSESCLIFQEILVRFAGFGSEEDEWVNIRKHVRPRSLPCESSECVAVLPGDLILCFQVGNSSSASRNYI